MGKKRLKNVILQGKSTAEAILQASEVISGWNFTHFQLSRFSTLYYNTHAHTCAFEYARKGRGFYFPDLF